MNQPRTGPTGTQSFRLVLLSSWNQALPSGTNIWSSQFSEGIIRYYLVVLQITTARVWTCRLLPDVYASMQSFDVIGLSMEWRHVLLAVGDDRIECLLGVTGYEMILGQATVNCTLPHLPSFGWIPGEFSKIVSLPQEPAWLSNFPFRDSQLLRMLCGLICTIWRRQSNLTWI